MAHMLELAAKHTVNFLPKMAVEVAKAVSSRTGERASRDTCVFCKCRSHLLKVVSHCYLLFSECHLY